MVVVHVAPPCSAPFSADLVTGAAYYILRLPQEAEHPEAAAERDAKKRRDEERAAFGTYASDGGKTFTYRVKKEGAYGGYKIVTEHLDGGRTREDLLEMRAKKKSDRYCM